MRAGDHKDMVALGELPGKHDLLVAHAALVGNRTERVKLRLVLPRIPYGESIEAIKQLVDEGVAREAGVSNASIEQMDIAQEILGNKLIAVQNQFSPIYTETADTLEHAARIGISFVCWSPLGGPPWWR